MNPTDSKSSRSKLPVKRRATQGASPTSPDRLTFRLVRDPKPELRRCATQSPACATFTTTAHALAGEELFRYMLEWEPTQPKPLSAFERRSRESGARDLPLFTSLGGQ